MSPLGAPTADVSTPRREDHAATPSGVARSIRSRPRGVLGLGKPLGPAEPNRAAYWRRGSFWCVRNAVLRVVGAAGTIGVRALLVHAISDEARRFYEHNGFRASTTDPMTLMITIEEAQRILGEPG
jgi:hypothetical protein